MNQLCKVCGEPAAGFHFGAFTCEGCKSFFGRTYNNLSSISECKNNGECVINKKNRTACKACRLRKCLLVGMSKSGSRYGRRSNWFKIHCLLQEQQQQAGATMAAAATLLRPHPYLTPLFHHHAHARAITATGADESDSGASSADPAEDDSRSTLSCSKAGGGELVGEHSEWNASPKLPSPASDSEYFDRGRRRRLATPRSPASLPSISPGAAPRWLAPLPPLANPVAWRELWARGLPAAAAPAPDQAEPIDLSVKASPASAAATAATPPPSDDGSSDHELCIDVVDEPVKSVPLDLTLERSAADVPLKL